MRGEDGKKLQMIRKRIRSQQREKKLRKMREQILSNWVSEEEQNDTDYLLRLAIQKIEQNTSDQLNIYVNIHNIIWQCLLQPKDYSKQTKVLALWVFIKLTNSRQVLEYMIDWDFKQNWKRLLKLLQNYSKFSECFYQKMKTFLQILCEKYQIIPYHNKDTQNLPEQIWNVFNEQTTNTLIEIQPEQNEESQYYQLIVTYISFVPKEHIIPIINQGYAFKVLQKSNKTILLAILSKLQSLSLEYSLYQYYYEQFLEKVEEKKMIFTDFLFK